jgi:predicted nucleic-acid-binding Zn-ribbon protein
MKATQACPKCRHRKLIVVDEVRQPVGKTPELQPLYPAAAVTGRGVFGTEVGAGGRFETWICASCGFTEWYTTGREDLALLAKVPSSGVRILDGEVEGEGGPYR